MDDLVAAGARLAGLDIEPTPPVEGVIKRARRRRGRRRTGLAAGATVLVVAAAAVGVALGSSPDQVTVVSPAAHGAGPGGARCAHPSGPMLSAQSVGRDFQLRDRNSPRPAGDGSLSQTAVKPSLLGNPVVESETIARRGTPIGGGYSLSLYPPARTEPTQVFSLTQTVTFLTTQRAASSWFHQFAPSPVTPQVRIGSTLANVNEARLPAPHLGQQTMVTEQSLPGTDLPTTIQFIVRDGTTVTSLAFIGGIHLSPRALTDYVKTALDQLATRCTSTVHR